MELVGVIFATVLLFVMVIYFTLFPSVLNILLAFLFSWLLTTNRSWLSSVLCFFLISLGLTFATRLPDFAIDYLRGDDEVREILEPLELHKGDTLNLVNFDTPIEHRKAYFNTSGWQGQGWVGKIAGPDFYHEDIDYQLLGRGLRLNAGEPVPGAPTLLFDVQKGRTHQTVTLTLRRGETVIARYRRTERLRFWDEVGAGKVRHHFLHILKNSFWNWLVRIFVKTEFKPLNNFINEALIVNTQPRAVPIHAQIGNRPRLIE